MDEQSVPVSSEVPRQVPQSGVWLRIKEGFARFQANRKAFVVTMVSIAVVLGIFSGWVFSGAATKGTSSEGQVVAKPDDMEAGLADEATFRDSAEGKLEEGGIDGEGTHHLVRDGGPSQYVYLTSTVIDLSVFKDKKIKVWGETIAARHAGWLMDVGKVKVVE